MSKSKGKEKEDIDAISKEESFAQLLMGGEEDFDGYLQENETLDADPEPLVDENELLDDDDEDSLQDWINTEEVNKELIEEEEEQFIDDSEITDLLATSTQQRLKLKTGGQDEFEKDMEEFENNLALTSGIGIKGLSKVARKRALQGEIRLSDEIKRKLGTANGLYIARDYGAAIDILQEVIKENSAAHPAWNTLGLVHEELGNTAKSLQLRMVAAHLCNDASLWKELGQKSIENDAIKQAIYCFTKALVVDPNDVDALWDRSFLHKQLGRNADAITGFTKILEIMPHHFKVINELAQLYRVQGKTKEAIDLYNGAIEYHKDDEDSDNEEEENEFTDKLGYSEINMLSELYLILNDYRSALNAIKDGLRRIQHRQHETWWLEHEDDDDEYLDDESHCDFPIELRVRMGVCRVYLNQVRLGTRHFQYLLQYPATTYPDLHQDIAYAYYDKLHYEQALNVFQRIIDTCDELEADVLIRTADCYHEIGDLKTAVVFYVEVLEAQPDNLDVMMSLATVYEEQGEEDKALELVDFVMKKNRESRKQKKLESGGKEEIEQEPDKTKPNKKPKSKKASIFDEENHQSKAEMYRLRLEEKKREYEERCFTVVGMFGKLSDLDEKIGDNIVNADRSYIREYIRCAQDLYDDFSSTGAFYPDRRFKKFKGFYALRRDKKSKKNAESEASLQLEAQKMVSRLRTRVKMEDEDNMDLTEEERNLLEQEKANKRMAEDSHFRDVPFERWLHVFIKYAYMLAITRRVEESFEVLKKIFNANVFYHNLQFKTCIKMAVIGIGIVSDTDYIIEDGVRWFCNFYQFRHEPFRLFNALMKSGKEIHQYAHSTSLKYLGRTIRLMDALVDNTRKKLGKTNEDISNLDEIRELKDVILAMDIDPSTTHEQQYRRYYNVPEKVKFINAGMGIEAPEHSNPLVLYTAGNIMNQTRNHLAASMFMMRAYALAPNDRLICLSSGYSLLQAAMQRKTDDRHLQVMQGMMFIFEYVKLTGYCQESEYNLARAFHLLGLSHLAVPHYENALCLPSRNKAATEPEKPKNEVYVWPVPGKEEDDFDEEDETDLSRDAAYNLHLIYVISGSMSLAQILLKKYCSI